MCIYVSEYREREEIHPFHFADYFTQFIVRARSEVVNARRFLSVSGVCELRGDSALRYIVENPPVPDDQTLAGTQLFHFFDSIPGSQPSERPLFNNFDSFPLCIAFTVGDIRNESLGTLMYANTQPMLTLGSTIQLSIGGASADFNLDVTAVTPTRTQICLDGSNAFLYVNCQQVQSVPFQLSSSDAVSIIGVIGEITTLNNPYSVS